MVVVRKSPNDKALGVGSLIWDKKGKANFVYSWTKKDEEKYCHFKVAIIGIYGKN